MVVKNFGFLLLAWVVAAQTSRLGGAPWTPTTPWEAGRFDRRRGPKKILFGRMYEDPSIEASVFPPAGRVFCHRLRGLHRHGARRAPPRDGGRHQPRAARLRRRRLDGAPMETGTAERVMGLLRKLLPLAGWRRATVEAFLALDDPGGAARVLARARWTPRFFRAGFDLGLSVYRPPRRLRLALPPGPAAALRPRDARADGALLRHAPQPDEPLRARAPPRRRSRAAGARTRALAGEVEPRGGRRRRLPRGLPRRAASTASPSRTSSTARPRATGTGSSPPSRHAAAPGSVVVLRSFAEPGGARRGRTSRARDRSMLWGVVEARAAGDL